MTLSPRARRPGGEARRSCHLASPFLPILYFLVLFRSSPLFPPWGDLGPQSQTQEATQTVKGPDSIAQHPTFPAVGLL